MLVKDIEIMGDKTGLHRLVKKLFVLDNDHFYLGGVKLKDVDGGIINKIVEDSDSIIGCWDENKEWLVNKYPTKIPIDVKLDMPLLAIEVNRKSEGVKRMNYKKFIKLLESIYIDSFTSVCIGSPLHFRHKIIWKEKENPFW